MSDTTIPDPSTRANLSRPAWIGPYRIIDVLGEGGMGRVYLAAQDHPARQVALKVVRGATPSLIARLQREIATLATLEHPAIARLYAAGEASVGDALVPWLAMEYVPGMDLLAYAQANGLALAARLNLLIAIAHAVQHAHERGVIHRDLKPGNILVDGTGQPRILDFGVAYRDGSGDATLTLAGQVLGTLPYMSPEQLGGGDQRADARIPWGAWRPDPRGAGGRIAAVAGGAGHRQGHAAAGGRMGRFRRRHRPQYPRRLCGTGMGIDCLGTGAMAQDRHWSTEVWSWRVPLGVVSSLQPCRDC